MKNILIEMFEIVHHKIRFDTLLVLKSNCGWTLKANKIH